MKDDAIVITIGVVGRYVKVSLSRTPKSYIFHFQIFKIFTGECLGGQ